MKKGRLKSPHSSQVKMNKIIIVLCIISATLAISAICISIKNLKR
nr:MAG TPA: protein of unknown function (DUF4969) [Caudoviricetes sp.]